MHVATGPTPFVIDMYPGEGNRVVDSHDITIDLSGRSVREYLAVYSRFGRWCHLVWNERPGIYGYVTIVEPDQRSASCAIAERVVRELRDEPTELPHFLALKLVPRGYSPASTGNTGEVWCKTPPVECLRIELATDDLGPGVTIVDDGELVSVNVRGIIQFTLPHSARLTEADLLRLADSMLPRASP